MAALLRRQWSQELFDTFSLPSSTLESRPYNGARRKGGGVAFFQDGRIVITSYELAAAKAEDVLRGQWDLVVFDEAQRLRNVYRRDGSKRGQGSIAIRTAIAAASQGKMVGRKSPARKSRRIRFCAKPANARSFGSDWLRLG
jgi:hypothetical protein